MQVTHFPAAAANSLIEGYCDDFVALAAVLSQTLEQVSMRGINIAGSQPALERIENGMRALAEAIHELIERSPMPTTTAAPPATAAHTAPSLGRPAAGPSPGAAPTWQATPNQTQARPACSPQARQPSAAPTSRPPSSPPRPPAPPTNRSTPTASRAAPPSPAARPQARAQAPTTPSQPAKRPDAGDLRGTNASMPLRSVFQFVERTRKSGVLTVQLPNETITFEVAMGCIQSCSSSAPVAGELLGDLVVAAGHADAHTVDGLALEIDAKGNRANIRANIGATLVERGVLSNGQLLELLETQVRLRFRRACDAPTASYAFTAGDPQSSDGRMRLAPMELNHQPSWERQN